MKISVIICTHNPRPEYLTRTLHGLRTQTLPASEWELLVVDNLSRESVAGRVDLGWHPAARVVLEPELGLTMARLRGIDESQGEILVWVDDDNILAPDYLALAAQLARDDPKLGVWGCGDFIPEWEAPPAPALSPYLVYLAVGRAPADRWSNKLYDYAATPAGAGLCCRREVAHRYAAQIRHDPRRRALGRTGTGLGACEDHDFAFTAIDLGFGTGVFTSLRLTHVMPAGRVQEDYLLRLVEGHACSTVLLMELRDPTIQPPRRRWLDRVRGWRLRRSLGAIERRIHEARERGVNQAWLLISGRSNKAAMEQSRSPS